MRSLQIASQSYKLIPRRLHLGIRYVISAEDYHGSLPAPDFGKPMKACQTYQNYFNLYRALNPSSSR